MNSKLEKLRRRDFLKMAAIGGVALSIPVLGLRTKVFSSLSSIVPKSAFETSFNALGTTITIRIEDDILAGAANFAASQAQNEINRLEKILTRFPGGTQICELNQNADLGSPSSDVLNVLRKATYYSESTEGSFDVTVQPVLVMLQNYLAGLQPFPTDEQFEAAKNLINYENVSVTSNLISFEKPGMGVTLDGIAVGYIIDRAVNALKSQGIRSAYLNAGGSVAAIGSRADGSPWQIAIADPLNPSSTIGTLSVRDQVVATTGDYVNFFTPNKDYYQIIAPSTARSPLYSHMGTVVAPTALEADPLDVALMVEDPADAMKLMDAQGVEALLYTRSDGIKISSGMKQLVTMNSGVNLTVD